MPAASSSAAAIVPGRHRPALQRQLFSALPCLRRAAPGLLAGVDMELAQRMLDAVDQIPTGRVSTYGDVAATAGSRSARLAGFVLAQLSDEDTPWHRVVRADGTPAPHLADEQLARLRAEGVTAVDGRVSLARYRFRG